MSNEISHRLTELREKRGLSRRQVAEMLNIPYTTYCHYEDDSIEMKVSVLFKIANFYKVSADWIAGSDDSMSERDILIENLKLSASELSEKDIESTITFAKFLKWKSEN